MSNLSILAQIVHRRKSPKFEESVLENVLFSFSILFLKNLEDNYFILAFSISGIFLNFIIFTIINNKSFVVNYRKSEKTNVIDVY